MKLARARTRLVLASLLTLGASLTASGQAVAEKDEQATKPEVLKITLSSLESSVCSNRPLVLELQIENVGREEIKFDRVDILRVFSYGYLTENSDRSMRGGGMSKMCSHCRGNYISLLPGIAIWEKHEFELHDFFQVAGDYSLKTRLSYKLGDKELDVESNEIEFEVRLCRFN